METSFKKLALDLAVTTLIKLEKQVLLVHLQTQILPINTTRKIISPKKQHNQMSFGYHQSRSKKLEREPHLAKTSCAFKKKNFHA